MNREWEMLDPSVMGDEQRMYDLFRYLREEEPVCYLEHPDFDPCWACLLYTADAADDSIRE